MRLYCIYNIHVTIMDELLSINNIYFFLFLPDDCSKYPFFRTFKHFALLYIFHSDLTSHQQPGSFVDVSFNRLGRPHTHSWVEPPTFRKESWKVSSDVNFLLVPDEIRTDSSEGIVITSQWSVRSLFFTVSR